MYVWAALIGSRGLLVTRKGGLENGMATGWGLEELEGGDAGCMLSWLVLLWLLFVCVNLT